jgi:hypothetical protein
LEKPITEERKDHETFIKILFGGCLRNLRTLFRFRFKPNFLELRVPKNAMISNSLNRRQFLRAVGVSLALPTLGSLSRLTATSAIAPEATKATRLVCVGANLGLHGPSLFPKETGSDYTVTPLLKDLIRHKDQLSLFSGLDHRAPNGHNSWDNYLCGNRVGDVTLDQIAAKKVGTHTRFESLQLSAGKGSFRQQMVFNQEGIPLPTTERPSVVYQKLFGLPEDVERTEYLIKSGHSSLDKVTSEAKHLQNRVSQNDKDKLEEYFSSVRDLEQRMERQLKGLHDPRPVVDYQLPAYDPIAPTLMLENQALMYDLMSLALETDSTRVITMFLPGLGQVFTINGEMLSAGYHALSHHGNNPEMIADLIKVEAEHMFSGSAEDKDGCQWSSPSGLDTRYVGRRYGRRQPSLECQFTDTGSWRRPQTWKPPCL